MILPKYFVPKDLECAVERSEDDAYFEGVDSKKENQFSLLLNELKNIDCLEIAKCHYLQFLKLGLYLEEYQQRRELSKFEIYRSLVERVDCSKNKFKIYIKNLDEENSVLSPSDSLKIYEYTDPSTSFFVKVTNICKDHIIVTATKRFCEKYNSLAKYNIVLTFNTYIFQCCHYALTVISPSMISQCFFPEKKENNSPKTVYKQYWFNRNVFSNPEQNQAVLSILSKSAFPAPYILYGPPGTGKTSTLVEAVSQIWKLLNVFILICTPSNAASDVIAKRLLDYIPAENVYRVYNHSQDYTEIDEDIKKCCNYEEDGMVDDLKKVDFSSKKVIVTTLCTSLRLQELNLCFSHVFIDEAGQATLAEALLPLCAVKSSPYCQIIISGDHQQLGPSIRSKLAEPILGQSILEKLMKEEPYRKNSDTGYDPRYITKLIRNFRSYKDIIHVSNALFYDNELIACRNKANLNMFPVAFYSVEATEQKSSNSRRFSKNLNVDEIMIKYYYSSYNEDEIKEVVYFTKNFIGKTVGDKIIGKKDIGIVTPFSLQASKIRHELNNVGLDEVDVGTVEIYQGQEKEIIIITTVRSKTFIHDGVEHIGFLSNPKRFNVALTRAKTCLIVVGNPYALVTNKYWRYFLRFCLEKDACRGDEFQMLEEHFYLLNEVSIESKIKKSTDLFDKSLTIFRIDDGQEDETPEKNNNSIKETSITVDNPTSIRIVPATTGGMNALMRDICYIRSASETSSRSPVKNINSIQNTPVTTGNVKLPRDIYKLQNTSTPAVITNAPVNEIDLVEDNQIRTDGLNTPSMNINSIKNNPIKTDSLNTAKDNIDLNDNISKCESDEKVIMNIKKSFCTIL